VRKNQKQLPNKVMEKKIISYLIIEPNEVSVHEASFPGHFVREFWLLQFL
jgi:hypothetical protein